MRVSVLLGLFLVLLSASLGDAQTTSCGAGPFDLSSLTGSDLVLDQSAVGGQIWAVRPCGAVTTAGLCSTTAAPATFCQTGTVVAIYNASAVGNASTDYASFGVDNEPIWTLVTRNGQHGVAQIIADGNPCGSSVGSRQGTVEYLCNPAATTAYMSEVFETAECHYEAVVQTSAVCGVSQAAAQASGLPVMSTQCGGGVFDLSGVAGQDIVDYATGLAVNICGALSTPYSCAYDYYAYGVVGFGLSVCQFEAGYYYSYYAPVNVSAQYSPYRIPTLYLSLGDGVGVSQIIQDGLICNGNTERLVNISVLCDSSADTPYIASATESPACHFHIAVHTSSICGQTAFSPALAAPTTTQCQYGPYNLTSISGNTVEYYDGNDHWSIRPCGTIVDVGLCPAQFCQERVPVSYYNASWTPADEQSNTGSDSVPIWSTVYYGGQQGVAQIIQNGAPCLLGYSDYEYYLDARQGAIYFLCNETATAPFLQSITESPSCHYTAIVQTAAACGVSTAEAHQPGLSVISTQCGGGIYSLASLSADITGYNLAGNNWTVNLCGPQTTVAGCDGYSTCQWGYNYAYPLTNYTSRYPIVYTFTAQGVEQIIQDGRANCYGSNTQRFTNVSLICDSTATTPVMVDVVEEYECHYFLTIRTSAVCGAPLWDAGSSSGGAAMLASSSSASALPSGSPLMVGSVFGGNFESPYPLANDGGQYQYNPPVTVLQPWTWTDQQGGIGSGTTVWAPPYPGTPNGHSPSPGQYAFIQTNPGDAGSSTSTMSAAVAGFTVGQQYTVSFYYGARSQGYTDNATDSQMTVFIGSTQVWQSAAAIVDLDGWAFVSVPYTAVGSSAQMVFQVVSGNTVDHAITVDSVLIVSTASPLPTAGSTAFTSTQALSFQSPSLNDSTYGAGVSIQPYMYNPPITSTQPWAWTQGLGGIAWYGNSNPLNPPSPALPPSAGGQYAFIQVSPNGELGDQQSSMSTTLTGLTVGAFYQISFYTGTRAGYSQASGLTVSVDGAAVYSGQGNVTDAAGWNFTTTGIFTAASSSAALVFTVQESSGSNADGAVLIDAIAVFPSTSGPPSSSSAAPSVAPSSSTAALPVQASSSASSSLASSTSAPLAAASSSSLLNPAASSASSAVVTPSTPSSTSLLPAVVASSSSSSSPVIQRVNGASLAASTAAGLVSTFCFTASMLLML